jgi:hypothetical protein
MAQSASTAQPGPLTSAGAWSLPPASPILSASGNPPACATRVAVAPPARRSRDSFAACTLTKSQTGPALRHAAAILPRFAAVAGSGSAAVQLASIIPRLWHGGEASSKPASVRRLDPILRSVSITGWGRA